MNNYSNPISALLNGPDIPYKQILINDENKQSHVEPCRDQNSFLQIHVRKFIGSSERERERSCD